MDNVALAALVGFGGVPAALAGYILGVEAGLRRLSPREQRALRPWVWLAPALLFVAIFLVYPLASTIVLSVLGPESGRFVGLANYRAIFADREMWVAFRNNVVWLVAFTSLALAAGVALAILTDRVPFDAAAKTALFMPQAISFVAAGVTWKFVYAFRPAGDPQVGLLNALLAAAGRPVHAWLVLPWVNTFALILVAVWVWTGFCVIILSAALRAIPPALVEAARVDGANEWQLLRRVTLPLIGPTAAVIATTLVIFALRAFDIVYVMTNGNFDTEVIANRMYKEMFTFRDFGRASAIAVILMAVTSPAIAANIRRFRRPSEAPP